jgi:hypothetical protein
MLDRILFLLSVLLASCRCDARWGASPEGKEVRAYYRQKQKQLETDWADKWRSDLPCAMPTKAGHVTKQAHGIKDSHTLRMTASSYPDVKFYVKENLPLYRGCQVWVISMLPASRPRPFRRTSAKESALQIWISHQWKFIFLRQPKSSSTAILGAVRKQLCGVGKKGKGACLPEEFRRYHDGIDGNVWSEYFVFTFVRNPWTRMMSAYRMFTGSFLHRCELFQVCSKA